MMRLFGWNASQTRTTPLGDELSDAGSKFARVAELRSEWANARGDLRIAEAANNYWNAWSRLADELHHDRTIPRPRGAPVAPFKWTTREGVAVESSVVRMETICCCVAMAEFRRADKDRPGERRWLLLAWEQTRLWIDYPNYCLPCSLREDFLAARAGRLTTAAADPRVDSFVWLAVVERAVDDAARAGAWTHPRDADAYLNLVSGGEMLGEALLQTLRAQERSKCDANSLARMAREADRLRKKRAPGASGECALGLKTYDNGGRHFLGELTLADAIGSARKSEENNDARNL